MKSESPPLRLAVLGKGGAGKSMICGTMARLLARDGHRVLVLDSDPMPGVAISLGLGPIADAMLTEAVEKGDDGRWRLRKGIGAARAIARFSVPGPDGIRLLQSGKATVEGTAPIMPSINGFNHLVYRLARDRVLADWTILGDLPAGTRQAAFGWVPYSRLFLIVVENTWPSILTARRLARLARSRADAVIWFVANKVDNETDVAEVEGRLGEPVAGSVPRDREAMNADREGQALLDYAPESPAVTAIARLTRSLVSKLD